MRKGKVARILNSREVAINIGQDAGVEVGMQFDILADEPEEVVDPDNNKVLGTINRPKVRVRVCHVDKLLAVATTFQTRRVNVGGTGSTFGAAFVGASLSRALSPPKWIDRMETLKTSERTWEDLDESESYVKTGDVVVEVSVEH